jgi:Delta3-Delta2-enoyl-CoA isomerase
VRCCDARFRLLPKIFRRRVAEDMIITTDHGPIRELQLNRPPVNALTRELLSALRQAIEQAARDAVRALIVSGQNTFSAGLDIRLLVSADRAGIESLWRELYQLMKALAASPIPIAAAITGHAPAGGTVIALFCDWRVAARGDFKLGLTEVQVGIPLPPVILAALRRQVGPRQAELLAGGGLVISSEQAYKVGLVDELAAPGEVVERALQWCRTRIALPAQAMLLTRSRARADLVALFEGDAERELRSVIEAWWSPEAQTTLRAIVDRMTQKPTDAAGDR